MNILLTMKRSLKMSISLKVSLLCISILALNGCMAMTIISGVVGGVDSVAKEIKINKLEKEIEEIKKDRDE